MLPKEISNPDYRDVAFYDMAVSEGWNQLKEIIEVYKQQLDLNLDISAEDTVENIGFKYLAASLAKSYLNQLLVIVETSYGVIKEREEQK